MNITRILFLLTVLANMVLAIASIWWLPNPAAIHFDGNGNANSFSSPVENMFFVVILSVLTVAIVISISYLMSICPNSSFNMPNKDYWLSEERRPETIKKFSAALDEMGIGAMAFSLLCQYVILCANRVASPCLSKITLYIGVAVFLLYVFIIFIKLLLAFRLPIHPRNHIMKKPREIYHRPANRDDGANPAEPYYEEAEGK